MTRAEYLALRKLLSELFSQSLTESLETKNLVFSALTAPSSGPAIPTSGLSSTQLDLPISVTYGTLQESQKLTDLETKLRDFKEFSLLSRLEGREYKEAWNEGYLCAVRHILEDFDNSFQV
jgi:hypothetical protein